MIFQTWKNWKRKKIKQRPFPLKWLEIINQRIPYYQLLPDADKKELLGHAQIFLYEKHFEGCGGVIVTDEMRVVIAAQACILLLHRPPDYFPLLESILIYPHPFISKVSHRLPGGIVSEENQARDGESWGFGTVILAWDDVLNGARDTNDGHNVVMHEFAHQLDEESGSANGAPVLELRSQYTAWARVLSDEFHKLNLDLKKNRKSVMDKYGATNPAEFFAVATETFFEKPVQLKKKHPELYEELKLFYRQDPATQRDLLDIDIDSLT
jgi:Mlc titration factor MtfA (ptsG expression regulator)